MSNIDASFPIVGTPTTQSVRDNFAAAKSEIEALQTFVASGGTVGGAVTISVSGNTPGFVVDNSSHAGWISLRSSGTNQIAGYLESRRGGVVRWSMELGTSSAESGGNVGSDFAIRAWSDAGGLLYTPLSINRSTGVTTISRGTAFINGTTFGSVQAASATDLSKHIALYGSTFGFGITTSRLNYVAGATSGHWFIVDGVDTVSIGATIGMLKTTYFSNGASFGSVAASGVADLSKHIALYSTTMGINITSARMNYVLPSGSTHVFVISSADVLTVGAASVTAAQPLFAPNPAATTSNTQVATTAWSNANLVPFVLQSGGSIDYNAVTGQGLPGYRQFGGPITTTNAPLGGAAEKGTILSGSAANAGFPFQLFLGVQDTVDIAPIFYRTMPGAAVWNRWCRLMSDAGGKFIGNVGFNNSAPIAKPTVSGSRGGNAALASLLTALASYGLITDSSAA